MNRRIVFSLISIVSVVGMVGGSAFAAFSSTASNNGNSFGAGTLVLSINTVTGSSSSPVFSVVNAAPGDITPVQILDLKNEGSVTANTLLLSGIDIGGNTVLADNLILELAIDLDNNNAIDPGETITSGPLTSPGWTGLSLGSPLAGGANRKLLARITFNMAAPDSVQGVSTSFNFNFQASQ